MRADDPRHLALLERFLDGALDPAQVQVLEARLAAEPGLQSMLTGLRRERELRQAAAAPVMRAPAGFSAELLARVRAQPPRAELQRQEEVEFAASGAESFARRLLLAALVLIGLALLFGWQSLLSAEPEGLEADSQELRKIDDQVRKLKAATRVRPR